MRENLGFHPIVKIVLGDRLMFHIEEQARVVTLIVSLVLLYPALIGSPKGHKLLLMDG